MTVFSTTFRGVRLGECSVEWGPALSTRLIYIKLCNEALNEKMNYSKEIRKIF